MEASQASEAPSIVPPSKDPSIVPLTVNSGQVEDDSSFVAHFTSPSKIPLSMCLPDFFFALGPWKYPDSPVRPDPLQVDMLLLAEGSSGDPVFLGH